MIEGTLGLTVKEYGPTMNQLKMIACCERPQERLELRRIGAQRHRITRDPAPQWDAGLRRADTGVAPDRRGRFSRETGILERGGLPPLEGHRPGKGRPACGDDGNRPAGDRKAV